MGDSSNRTHSRRQYRASEFTMNDQDNAQSSMERLKAQMARTNNTKARRPPSSPALNETLITKIPSGFTQEQQKQLIALVDANSVAGVIDSSGHDSKAALVRRSDVTALSPEEFPWVYQRMWNIAQEANQRYQFKIEKIPELIQIAVYDETQKGHYDWHADAPPLTRKLSVSVPLVDPSNYDGGELQFNDGGTPSVSQEAGVAVVFPSFVLHRVTPVTRGRRYSMVAWIGGPSWC